MPTNAYDEILKRAQSELTTDEQSRLADQLAIHAAREEAAERNNGKQHKITDLRGLGKEIWEGIDPDQYVAEERDSWDG